MAKSTLAPPPPAVRDLLPHPVSLLLLPPPAVGPGERCEELTSSFGGGLSGEEVSPSLTPACRHARGCRWGEAAELAQGIALRSGGSGEREDEAAALLLLGSVQYRRGRWDEAQAVWEEIVSRGRCLPSRMGGGSSPLWRQAALLALARLAIRRGDGAQAGERLRQALGPGEEARDGELSTLSWIARALLAAASGREAEATQALTEADARIHIGMDPTPPELGLELVLARAECLLLAGDFHGAATRAEEAGADARAEGNRYAHLRGAALEAEALLGVDPAAAHRLATDGLRRARELGAGRLLPWFFLLTSHQGNRARSAPSPGEERQALEERQDSLQAAYRVFRERGERRGEQMAALELARIKLIWGASRGAVEWHRRAAASIEGGPTSRHWQREVETLAEEIENSLAKRLASHREIMGRLLSPGSPTTADVGRKSVSVSSLLEAFRSYMGARRATLLRLIAPDLVEPVATGGAAWSVEELNRLPRILDPKKCALLTRGETVFYSRSPFTPPGADGESRDPGGAIVLPLAASESVATVLIFEGSERGEGFLPGTEELVVAGVAAEALRGALEELSLSELSSPDGAEQPVRFGDLLTRNRGLKQMLVILNRVAGSGVPVLLEGETGTGKELLARALHEKGGWPGKFVAQNCAALPESLLEAELFGHAAGAFTGAARFRLGLLESAHEGTFLLDEVAEVSPGIQAKLLRVLENGEVRRLGENETRQVQVRVVAATNRDLGREVEEKRFRRDLYYRLNTVSMRISPLRERREDIPLLARHFLRRTLSREKKELPGFTREAVDRLLGHDWPGNVRELENQVRRAVALSPPGRPIGPELFSLPPLSSRARAPGLKEETMRFERERILDALARAGGNRTQAARLLGGMSRTTLLTKMKRLGIVSPSGRDRPGAGGAGPPEHRPPLGPATTP